MERKSISHIKTIFEKADFDEYKSLIDIYACDERAGVQNLIKKYKKEISNLEAERERLKGMTVYEKKHSMCTYICGIDEAGRGPFAGPVVAGACILPKDVEILYLNDSKKLSEKKREALYTEITQKALAWSVGIADEKLIDEINILNATYVAMREAVSSLCIKPDILLVDSVHIPEVDIAQDSFDKGDAKSISIAAASILAKVTRDHIMYEMAEKYPMYGFEKNKGYGTAAHIEALRKYGASPIHRRTFIHAYI